MFVTPNRRVFHHLFRAFSSRTMAAVKRPAEEAIGSEPLKAANGTNGADASQNADERPEPLAAQTPETVSEAPAKRQKVNSGDNRGGGNGDRGGKPGKQRNTRRGTWQSREKPESDEDADDKDPRAPKKKVALLMSFCGTGYQGMQMWASDGDGFRFSSNCRRFGPKATRMPAQSKEIFGRHSWKPRRCRKTMRKI